MNKVIEQKGAIVTLCIISLLFCWSCKNENDQLLLSDEQISSNLLTIGGMQGSIDPELLVGEWFIEKFAYTANGNRISNVAKIPIDPYYDIEWIASQNGISIKEAIDVVTPKLKMPDPPITPLDEWIYWDDVNENLVENSYVLWFFLGCNSGSLFCSLSENLINLKGGTSTMKGCPNSSDDDIIPALNNAYSFVVKGDELIIYFKGDRKKNLLILKKR